jgi:hypothetical protein
MEAMAYVISDFGISISDLFSSLGGKKVSPTGGGRTLLS